MPELPSAINQYRVGWIAVDHNQQLVRCYPDNCKPYRSLRHGTHTWHHVGDDGGSNRSVTPGALIGRNTDA
jgi:hypothetical protein